MRLLQNLARKLLNRPEPPPNRAHPVGAVQVTISPDTSKLIRTAHPALSHLHHLHHPRHEHGQSHPVGRTDVCRHCMHSPFTNYPLALEPAPFPGQEITHP